MTIKMSNLMRKYCSGNTKDEVAWCGFYGSDDSLRDGNCKYKNR